VSSIFKFKEFDVLQKDSVLKVGTDSMLLGAIIDAGHSQSGLDLGAGTGVLSLMVAQKNKDIYIDAIENDIPTYKECNFNFKSSQYSNRLVAISDSYFEYPFEKKYDLIFSNPPFYIEEGVNMKPSNRLSKHGSIIKFKKLASLVVDKLAVQGCFWIVLPYELYNLLVDMNVFNKLFINELYNIHSKESKLNSRVIVKFSFTNKKMVVKDLVLRKSDNTYTSEYIELTKDFHFNKL